MIIHTRAIRPLLAMLALSSAAAAHAQLYKWIGPDGKVTYSDAPPPAMARKMETRPQLSSVGGTADLPFELAETVKHSPVALYTAAKCIPCDEGRAFLNTRGIPFQEKTVTSNEDIARLREAGGDAQLPFLLVGRTKHTGFQRDAWSASLTAAGYPETSKLPKTYRNPPVEAAAPAIKPVAAKPAAAERPVAGPPEDVPAPAGNAPPGFRF